MFLLCVSENSCTFASAFPPRSAAGLLRKSSLRDLHRQRKVVQESRVAGSVPWHAVCATVPADKQFACLSGIRCRITIDSVSLERFLRGYRPVFSGQETLYTMESLILAQDERWLQA